MARYDDLGWLIPLLLGEDCKRFIEEQRAYTATRRRAEALRAQIEDIVRGGGASGAAGGGEGQAAGRAVGGGRPGGAAAGRAQPGSPLGLQRSGSMTHHSSARVSSYSPGKGVGSPLLAVGSTSGTSTGVSQSAEHMTAHAHPLSPVVVAMRPLSGSPPRISARTARPGDGMALPPLPPLPPLGGEGADARSLAAAAQLSSRTRSGGLPSAPVRFMSLREQRDSPGRQHASARHSGPGGGGGGVGGRRYSSDAASGSDAEGRQRLSPGGRGIGFGSSFALPAVRRRTSEGEGEGVAAAAAHASAGGGQASAGSSGGGAADRRPPLSSSAHHGVTDGASTAPAAQPGGAAQGRSVIPPGRSVSARNEAAAAITAGSGGSMSAPLAQHMLQVPPHPSLGKKLQRIPSANSIALSSDGGGPPSPSDPATPGRLGLLRDPSSVPRRGRMAASDSGGARSVPLSPLGPLSRSSSLSRPAGHHLAGGAGSSGEGDADSSWEQADSAGAGGRPSIEAALTGLKMLSMRYQCRWGARGAGWAYRRWGRAGGRAGALPRLTHPTACVPSRPVASLCCRAPQSASSVERVGAAWGSSG